MGNSVLGWFGRAFWRMFHAVLVLVSVYICAGVAWVNTRDQSLEILAGVAVVAFFMSLRLSDNEEEHAQLLAEIHKLRKELNHGKDEVCCKEDCGSKADR